MKPYGKIIVADAMLSVFYKRIAAIESRHLNNHEDTTSYYQCVLSILCSAIVLVAAGVAVVAVEVS